MRNIFILASILTLFGCSSISEASCSNPTIKGNLTTYNGEKIYHVPGGQFYEVTDAERMFCNEQDAIEDGFRKSER